jgi:hypothetical protein
LRGPEENDATPLGPMRIPFSILLALPDVTEQIDSFSFTVSTVKRATSVTDSSSTSPVSGSRMTSESPTTKVWPGATPSRDPRLM